MKILTNIALIFLLSLIAIWIMNIAIKMGILIAFGILVFIVIAIVVIMLFMAS